MPVWLSLFTAIFMTLALFGGLYALILALLGFKSNKAKPRVGAASSDKEGSLAFWVKWDSTAFALQFYRLKVSHYSPESTVKEGVFSVTWEPPQKESFLQVVDLPVPFKDLLTEGQVGKKSVVTVEFKTIDNFVVAKDFYLAQLKEIYLKRTQAGPEVTRLPAVGVDVPSVSTLDYQELVERRKKLKTLEAEAKAKAAKAAPKPAAPAPAPAPEKPPEDKPVAE